MAIILSGAGSRRLRRFYQLYKRKVVLKSQIGLWESADYADQCLMTGIHLRNLRIPIKKYSFLEIFQQ